MSFIKQKHASGLVGGLVVMVAVGYIVRVVLAGGFENYHIPGRADDNAMMAELATIPGNGVMMEQLEASFPDEYDDFRDTLARSARSEGGEDRVVMAANAWIARFFSAHARDFSASPVVHLDRVMELEQNLFEALREHDEFACAFVARREPLDQPLPTSFDEMVGELMAARFAAIRAGRSDQQLRFALTPKDYEAVEATLRERGLNDEQIAVVFGTADPATIGAPLACEMRIELIKGIRAQEEERRALLIGAYAAGTG